MKQYFILLKHHWVASLKQNNGLLKFSLLMAILFLLSFPFFSTAQQYVKTYKAYSPCGQISGDLMLNCITKTKTPGNTFYIAGTQDSSIYIAEVDAMGAVLQEKLIGVKSNTYSLRSMITDDQGNIVIIGTTSNTYPTSSYLMKVSPALSLLLHRTYSNVNINGLSQLIFTDIKDFQASGTYYISGGIREANNVGGSDVLLLRLDRNNGNVIYQSKYNHGQEDNYDALVVGVNRTNPPDTVIEATGRLSRSSSFTFRPWINRHNNALIFASGARYLQNEAPPGRLYSSSLITDAPNNVLYCWHGDFTGALGLGKNVGAASFTGLTPIWQTEYLITPQPQQLKFLNKIATDPKGYVAEGNWWDGSTTSLGGYIGEMFLIRTTKAGLPVWSRKLNNVLVNSVSHNAAFVIDGNSIFSVGFKRSTSGLQNDGVLVRIPLVDGAMDTSCAPVQNVVVKQYQFNTRDSVAQREINLKNSINYYPVNCIKTDTVTNCNQPCVDTAKLDADFDLSGLIQRGNTTNYIVTASGFDTNPNSQWIVSKTTNVSPFPDVSGTVYSSISSGMPGAIWANAAPTSFGGYVGTTIVAPELTTASTSFLMNERYRFKHILSYTNNCGVTVSDTVIKTIHMCPGCRSIGKTGPMVETEKASSSGKIRSGISQTALLESSDVRIIPNPVKTGSFTLVYKSPVIGKFSVSIEDIQGKKVVVKTFSAAAITTSQYSINVSNLANGMYTVSIFNDGKSTTQKIVIAK